MSQKRPREGATLFAAAGMEQDAPHPLPDKLRPRTLSDVVGQDHILGPDGALKRMLATRTRREMGKGTLLFVDEVHRFNRAQQDSFLPVMENGTVVLVGATTENPSFEL